MLALSLVTVMNGCEKDDDENQPSSSGPPANEVWMQNIAFTPSTITVSVNTTVTWRNMDSVVHTVTADDGSFNSGNISGGGTFSRQFTAPGTYAYHCVPHPQMTAQVIVQ